MTLIVNIQGLLIKSYSCSYQSQLKFIFKNSYSLQMREKFGECHSRRHFGSLLHKYTQQWQFLLPDNPAVSALGIYPSELKTNVHTKTCTRTFIEVLFITVKTWSNQGVLL